MRELPNKYWFSVLMSILTAALSVGLIHFTFQNENEVVETFIDIIKVLSLLLITFIGITILRRLV